MNRSPLGRQRPTISIVQALAVASYFGVSLAISVVLGYLAGQWVDGRLNTGFIFTLIGVLLGLAGAMASAVRVYRATFNKSSQTDWHAQTTESAPDVANESGGDH